MKRSTKLSIMNREDDRDVRDRMSSVRVLIADRDIRTATLVQKIIFSFGIRMIDVTTDGEEALEFLKSKPYDFLITEWNMHPFDGIELVKTIRSAKEDKRIKRDIPIIMMTASAELEHVQIARDAGISEFVAKPFSAKTISSRIIQIIDNPRMFVESNGYTGPCRRRRGEPPKGVSDRRAVSADAAHVSPPDFSMLEKLGLDSVREIINEGSIEEAQVALLSSRNEFIIWARDDIEHLTATYNTLIKTPDSVATQVQLKEAAYAIQSRAGVFGYQMGTEVAGLLVSYINNHPFPTRNHLLVIGKHIETLRAIFNPRIEQGGQQIGQQLILSLRLLISKME